MRAWPRWSYRNQLVPHQLEETIRGLDHPGLWTKELDDSINKIGVHSAQNVLPSRKTGIVGSLKQTPLGIFSWRLTRAFFRTNLKAPGETENVFE